MLKRLGLLIVLAGLIIDAAACSDDGGGGKTATFKIGVDGKSDQFAASFIAYFPNEFQVHPGDEVDFSSTFTGEPHTVTLGTQVDDIFALVAEACPNGGLADPACQQGPPPAFADRYNAADAKNPQFFPDDPAATEPNQTAAQPCFLATGAPPTDGSACSADQQTQPDFDGTETFYNSGWLENEQVFSVKLADDIAPGEYSFYCLVHREGMSGKITVVEDATDIPSPDDVQQQGDDALNEMVTKLQPTADEIAAAPVDAPVAGGLSQDVQEATVNMFGPDPIDIATGDSVTWTIVGGHTIAFNAPASATPFVVRESDGTVVFNKEAGTPAIINGAPDLSPDQPPPDPLNIDGGAFDGQGFANSGFLDAFEGTVTYKLTFSTAGTYTLICLIHPDMEATVNVSG